METRETLRIDENVDEAAASYGNPVLSGEMPKSVLFVPLVTGGRAIGVISLQNIDREHAFTDSDQQLLETLAGSLSVALENARLVHETRQRNAELALINSVQEALAGELEMQAIYDVVGDKIREIFDAQVVDIGIYDFAAGLTRYPYSIERGVRFPDEPTPIEQSPTTREILEDEVSGPDQRRTGLGARARPERSHRPGRARSVRARRPSRLGRRGSRADLPPEPRPGERVRRGRRASADDAGGQPERGARERAAGARDAAAERRAGADQQRAGRDRGRARAAGDLRGGRRADPGRLRCSGRADLDARRGDESRALPVHLRGR